MSFAKFLRIFTKVHELASILFRASLLLVGVSTVAGILAIVGLPSAVDVCDVPIKLNKLIN